MSDVCYIPTNQLRGTPPAFNHLSIVWQADKL